MMPIKIDKEIITVFLQRGWSSLSGIITIYFIAKYLTGNQQGVYYLISALSIIISFFDFGLNTATVQNTAQINASKYDEKEILERCKVVLYLSQKKANYYAAAYCCVILVFLYINNEKLNLTASESIAIFLTLSAISTLTLQTNLYIAFMEGKGDIKKSSKLKLISMMAGSIVLWAGISLGHSIPSLLISQALTAGILYALTKTHEKNTLSKITLNKRIDIRLSTRNQIKIALSGFSAYFVLNLPTYYLGTSGNLDSAGKFGMTFQLLGAITGFSIVFLNSKLYIYCGLYQKNEIIKLRSFHNKRTALSWAFLMLSIGAIALTFITLPEITLPIKNKIIDDEYYALIFITIAGINYYNGQSILFQSKGGDPLFLIGISRILVLVTIIALTSIYENQIYSLELSYAAMSLITIAITFFLSRRFFK